MLVSHQRFMRIILMSTLILIAFVVDAQEFQKIQTLPVGNGAGKLLWSDLENDGNKELLYTSLPKMKIYTQAGGQLVDTNADLPGFAGDFDLGDFDGDNDVDIVMGGLLEDGTRLMALYKNVGNYQF